MIDLITFMDDEEEWPPFRRAKTNGCSIFAMFIGFSPNLSRTCFPTSLLLENINKSE